MHGCFSSLSEMQLVWELPLLTRPQHFYLPEIGGAWPWYFLWSSLGWSLMRSRRYCDTRVSRYEIGLVFWFWLSVFVKMSCWDSCFPEGLSGMEISDGNSNEWPTVVAIEPLDSYCGSSNVYHEICLRQSFSMVRVFFMESPNPHDPYLVCTSYKMVPQ